MSDEKEEEDNVNQIVSKSQHSSPIEVETKRKESHSFPVLEENAKSSSISEEQSGESADVSSVMEEDKESVRIDNLETAMSDSKQKSSIDVEKESPVKTDDQDDPQSEEEEEEERNPLLSKFSKRFRFTRHKISLDAIENPANSYYPKDHMREGNLWSIRKSLIDSEKNTLEAWRINLADPLVRYKNMTNYLTVKNEIEKYLSEEDMALLRQSSGEEYNQLRKKLERRMQTAMQIEAKEKNKQRKKVMAQMQYVNDGPVCDGCPLPRKIRLNPCGGKGTLIRKFVGNVERFDIHNSTHCG